MRPLIDQNQWLDMVDDAIGFIHDALISYESGSLEELTLIQELSCLQSLKEHVQTIPSGNREDRKSHLIAVSSREQLDIDNRLIEMVGRSYEIYRLWANREDWK